MILEKEGYFMSIKNLTRYGVLLAILIVVTLIIKIPAVNQMGYLNLSDVLVIIYATLFPKKEIAFSAGLGTAVADLALGYGSYAPFTFLIKAIEASFIIIYLNQAKKPSDFKYFLMVFIALSFMVLSYGLVDAFIFSNWYYFYASILFNLNQAGVALIIILVIKEPVLILINIFNL